jgi:hypothetical protein
MVTQQSCVVRSHEDVPHVSEVDVVPVVVPDPLDPEPDPEDPDPDPVDPDPEDPPVLDPPDPEPVDPDPDPEDPPGLVPEPVPEPLSSTGASFPPHAIAKKIAANENAFVDFKTNLFLEPLNEILFFDRAELRGGVQHVR